jgi:hypothetical protein
MGSIDNNKLKLSYLMPNENAYMWHEHMGQGHTLVTVNYNCIYNVYILVINVYLAINFQ